MIFTGRSLRLTANGFRKKILKKDRQSIWNQIQTNFDELDREWDFNELSIWNLIRNNFEEVETRWNNLE